MAKTPVLTTPPWKIQESGYRGMGPYAIPKITNPPVAAVARDWDTDARRCARRCAYDHQHCSPLPNSLLWPIVAESAQRWFDRYGKAAYLYAFRKFEPALSGSAPSTPEGVATPETIAALTLPEAQGWTAIEKDTWSAIGWLTAHLDGIPLTASTRTAVAEANLERWYRTRLLRGYDAAFHFVICEFAEQVRIAALHAASPHLASYRSRWS